MLERRNFDAADKKTKGMKKKKKKSTAKTSQQTTKDET
jgi:mannitol-specific phosphotransferase system IIBC component|eukprot:COSAG06_NODE_3226_length_5655_cov_3.893629_2_plen_38_part_00